MPVKDSNLICAPWFSEKLGGLGKVRGLRASRRNQLLRKVSNKIMRTENGNALNEQEVITIGNSLRGTTDF